ncbi:right-handed parallel beta-helix repeat-containing protein [Isoptericola halotolerans]|uniref:right-handed parallel beta-helix repeat-containing protein n=1 Tax=Isoptericola halotolerans TaxID=300560 RepID=UPI0038901ED1
MIQWRIVAPQSVAALLVAVLGIGLGGPAAATTTDHTTAATAPPPAEATDAPDHWTVESVRALSSDGNLPEFAVDDDPATRWSSLTESPEEPQWLVLDLGEVRSVGYLGIAWHKGEQRESLYEVETSTDGSTWQPAAQDQASSGTSSNLEPVVLGGDATSGSEARYVRYLGLGNSVSGWNSVTEIRVYPPNPDGAVVDDLSGLLPTPDPDAKPWTEPGLVTPAGDRFRPQEPGEATGRTIDVRDHGADPAPQSGDDAAAIRAALADAQPGDEVYLPEGTYDLQSTEAADPTTHVALRSGVDLRGDGDGTVLTSAFTPETQSGKVLRGYGVQDVRISDLTVSSTYDGPLPTDHQDDAAGGGPAYGIVVANLGSRASQQVLVEDVVIERFQKMGVRIEKSREVTVRGSTFREATSVGGGGNGYGISIQGTAGKDRYAYTDDSRHNVVVDNEFDGTHLRHSILLQYWTHNNLVARNTIDGGVLDAIDMHGEDEYLNEIRYNKVTDVQAAGIALGNTGGTATQHDAAGPGNWIHSNVLQNNREGILLILGTPDTLVERNVITRGRGDHVRSGIEVRNAPGTVVQHNTVLANRADGFWGIHLAEDPGDDGHASGMPTDVVLEQNLVVANTGGVRIDAGQDVRLTDNKIRGNRQDTQIDDGAGVTVE